MDSAEFLAHFGVKGMHWGKRKPADDGKRFTEKEALSEVDKILQNQKRSAGKKAISDASSVKVKSTKTASKKARKELSDLLESETGEKVVLADDFDFYFD